MSLIIMISLTLSMISVNIKLVQADDSKIHIGDYIYLGRYNGKDIKWRCIGEDSNGKLMMSDSILCYKSFDAKYSEYTTGYRRSAGSNYWPETSLNHWLNTAGEVDWSDRSTPSSENIDGEIINEATGEKKNHYEDEIGFMSSFDSTELACVKIVQQKTYLNNYDSAQKDGGEDKFDFDANGTYESLFSLLKNAGNTWYKITEDRFFVLGPEQLQMGMKNLGEVYMNLEQSYWLRLPCNTGMSYENVAVSAAKNRISHSGASNSNVGVRVAFYLDEDQFHGQVFPAKTSSYFKIGEDSNRFIHSKLTYKIDNLSYRKTLWKKCNSFVDRIMMNFMLSTGMKKNGACHGISLSMCYGSQGYIDFGDITYNAKNYWTMDSPYNNNKIRDLVVYYHLTQFYGGNATTSIENVGWNKDSQNNKLSVFLQKLVNESKRSEEEKKPFLFSYKEGENEGHSVIICGYHKTQEGTHEITVYDVNSYGNGTPDYLTLTISSDFTSFDFTDANDMNIGDHWISLMYYGIDIIYNGGIDTISNDNLKQSATLKTVSDSDKTTIQIPVNKTFKLQNKEGRYLEYDGKNYTGDMTIYNSYINGLEDDPIWNLTVDKSEWFELSKAEDGCQLVCEDDSKTYAIAADGADQVKIQNEGIEVKGNSYKLSAATQSNTSEDEIVTISADVTGDSVITKVENNTSIQFNDTAENVKVSKIADFSEIVTAERDEIKDSNFVIDEKKEDEKEDKKEDNSPTPTKKPALKKQIIKTAKIKTYKAKNLKKKKVTFNLKAKSLGKAKLTYKVVKYPKKAKKYISVNKIGKVTLKKKAKKGIYKISITAKQTSQYKKGTKTVTIKVK